MVFAAPEWRSLGAGRRGRRERLHRPEEGAEHAVRRPAEQADRPTGTTDAHELVGGLLMVRGEHDADRRHDDVVRLVRERQLLGVRLDPLELETLGLRELPAGLEQARGQVAGRDGGAPASSRKRRVAGPGRDVEHAHARADPARIDEPLADGQQKRVDHQRVVT